MRMREGGNDCEVVVRVCVCVGWFVVARLLVSLLLV